MFGLLLWTCVRVFNNLQMQGIMRRLEGLNFVGMDVVEVCNLFVTEWSPPACETVNEVCHSDNPLCVVLVLIAQCVVLTVQVCPPYDVSEITSVAAASVIFEYLNIVKA